MPRLLRTSFVPIAKDKIGPLALNCITRLTGNAFYKDIAHYVSDMQAALTAYTPAAAIKNPVPEQTAALYQLRDALNAALANTARYANALYPDNEAALLSTGLDLTKEPEKRTTLEPPRKYELADGTEADTLCAKVTRAIGAVATEVRYTDAPELPWHQWLSVTTTRPSVLLRGYRKKTEVFAMFRSVGGDTDDQPFSEVLSRIVQ
jgi:phytoene dehydrogenase-like protein